MKELLFITLLSLVISSSDISTLSNIDYITQESIYLKAKIDFDSSK